MRFVYQWRFVGRKVPIMPRIRSRRIPHHSAELLRIRILDNISRPRRHAIAIATVPVHVQFVGIAVFQRARRQPQFPVTIADRGKSKCFVITPLRKFTLQVNFGRGRRPLPRYPSVFGTMQPKIFMAAGKILDSTIAV